MTEGTPSMREEELVMPKGVSIEDFKKPPTDIAPYIPPGPFTRDNLTNGIVFSFTLSRGSAASQKTFIDWVNLHTDPNIYTTFDNFLEAGGCQTLTDEEKNELLSKFRKRADHQQRITAWDARNREANPYENIQPLTDKKILDMIDGTFRGMSRTQGYATEDELRDMSWEEYKKKYTPLAIRESRKSVEEPEGT